ncbi:MAG: hypothetical protein ACRDZ3_12285 [Acidimicrobiia bacterium]
MKRRLGTARRCVGLAGTAAGVMLIVLAGYGIAVTGDVRTGMVSLFTALPGGLLLVLAGLDRLSRSPRRSCSTWGNVSFEEWVGTAQSRRHAAKAAFN